MHKFKLLAGAALVSLAATAGAADSWTLDGAKSTIWFGSIKNDYTGESHSFSGLTGTVDAAGTVALDVDLGSVETQIDIRNERMLEHVFQFAPSAKITASLDMGTVSGLAVGESTDIETTGILSLLGEELELDANLFVMRLSETGVMVGTNGFVMLSTEDIGIDGGIAKLQEIASLDSITRVSPVTMRLFFEMDK